MEQDQSHAAKILRQLQILRTYANFQDTLNVEELTEKQLVPCKRAGCCSAAFVRHSACVLLRDAVLGRIAYSGSGSRELIHLQMHRLTSDKAQDEGNAACETLGVKRKPERHGHIYVGSREPGSPRAHGRGQTYFEIASKVRSEARSSCFLADAHLSQRIVDLVMFALHQALYKWLELHEPNAREWCEGDLVQDPRPRRAAGAQRVLESVESVTSTSDTSVGPVALSDPSNGCDGQSLWPKVTSCGPG
ncbi:hypothetical protein K466DRAFT_602558 [Polyporus arcularius HHB13444]|uniref:Uncharacterized protein n=1 Tax=Polyporus arcularius HHB13444 TaxID=1314778 RepID=A0A5C3P6E7_9APHY|nr:hypothetical protein K466DRAFT_602558 [Polyporus arcularius HHB13444]